MVEMFSNKYTTVEILDENEPIPDQRRSHGWKEWERTLRTGLDPGRHR